MCPGLGSTPTKWGNNHSLLSPPACMPSAPGHPTPPASTAGSAWAGLGHSSILWCPDTMGSSGTKCCRDPLGQTSSLACSRTGVSAWRAVMSKTDYLVLLLEEQCQPGGGSTPWSDLHWTPHLGSSIVWWRKPQILALPLAGCCSCLVLPWWSVWRPAWHWWRGSRSPFCCGLQSSPLGLCTGAPGWDAAAVPQASLAAWGCAGRHSASEMLVTAPRSAVQCGCVAQTRLVKWLSQQILQ